MKNLFLGFILLCSECTFGEELLQWSREEGILQFKIEKDSLSKSIITNKKFDMVAFEQKGNAILAVKWKDGILEFDLWRLRESRWDVEYFSMDHQRRPLYLDLAISSAAEQFVVACAPGEFIWHDRRSGKDVYRSEFKGRIEALMISRDRRAVTFFETLEVNPQSLDSAPAIFAKLNADGALVRLEKTAYPTERRGDGWPLPAVETSTGTFAFTANYYPEPRMSRQPWEWDGNARSEPIEIKHVYSRSITEVGQSDKILIAQKDGVWIYRKNLEEGWIGEKTLSSDEKWISPIYYLSPSGGNIVFRNVLGNWIGRIPDGKLIKIGESGAFGNPKFCWIVPN